MLPHHPTVAFSKDKQRFVALVVFLVLALFASPANALVITPVWDGTITNDTNHATIEGTINSVIQFYEARFTDPVSLTIEFEEMPGSLGDSDWWYYDIPYGTFITYLKLDATTTNDTYALAHLPSGTNNPVDGSGDINVHVANLKAIGITNVVSGLPGGVDGIVGFDPSIMNLTRTSIDPSKYDLQSVVEHEMDEVMALGSYFGSGVAIDAPFPQDLFRYATNGSRNYTTSGDDAYFSLDGTNLLVQFNQQSDGDYGDWWSNGPHTPRVQDAFAEPGTTPDMGVELIALDVQGWNLVPPPQPGIARITLLGTHVIVNCTNGLATGTYYLLSTTNAASSLSKWSPVATNTATANGNFTFIATNAYNPNTAAQFYTVELLP